MTHDRGTAGPTALHQSMLDSAEAFWRLPPMLFMGWWALATAAWLPAKHVHHQATDDQLVVPEPLEETGEHALFA